VTHETLGGSARPLAGPADMPLGIFLWLSGMVRIISGLVWKLDGEVSGASLLAILGYRSYTGPVEPALPFCLSL
jgi:hypothetical protein